MRLILKNINAITDLCKDTGVRSKHSPHLVLDLNTDFFLYHPIITMASYPLVVVALMFYRGPLWYWLVFQRKPGWGYWDWNWIFGRCFSPEEPRKGLFPFILIIRFSYQSTHDSCCLSYVYFNLRLEEWFKFGYNDCFNVLAIQEGLYRGAVRVKSPEFCEVRRYLLTSYIYIYILGGGGWVFELLNSIVSFFKISHRYRNFNKKFNAWYQQSMRRNNHLEAHGS